MVFGLGGLVEKAAKWVWDEAVGPVAEEVWDISKDAIGEVVDVITGGDEADQDPANYPPGWFEGGVTGKAYNRAELETLTPIESGAVGPVIRTVTQTGGRAMTAGLGKAAARILIPAGAFVVGGELYDAAGQLLGYFTKTKTRRRRRRLLVQSDKEDLAYIAATLTPADRKYFLAQLAAKVGGR